MDEMKMRIPPEDLKRLEERYTKELIARATRTINKYTSKIAAEGRGIIRDESYVDTGRLVNSIHSGVKAYASKLVGEVSTSEKYARFIHEGAKHEGGKITSHFVPFRVAKTLFIWAERHGIIYRKTKTGKRARKSSNAVARSFHKATAKWYYYSKRTGKEYPINIKKGGLMVTARPTKFLEKPFEAAKDEFIAEMSRLVGGI